MDYRSEMHLITNKSEALCYQTKKQLDELENTATPEEKQKIESLISELEDAIKAENYSLMEELMESVQKAAMEIGERAYSTGDNNAEGGIDTDFSTEK